MEGDEFSLDEGELSFDMEHFIGGSFGNTPLGDSLGRTPNELEINDFDHMMSYGSVENNSTLPASLEGFNSGRTGNRGNRLSSSHCVHCGKRECICPKERCRLCLGEIMDQRKMLVLPCTHKFHHKCMLEYNSSRSGPSFTPKCPTCANRNTGTPSSSIHEYDTYDYLGNFHGTTKATSHTLNNGFVCRTVKCGNEICFDNIPENPIWKCGKCQAQYCLKCKREGHIGTCESYEWYLRTNQLKDFTVYQLFQQRKLKRCPRCQIYTHRYNTSPRITCERCSLPWCWYCIKPREECMCRIYNNQRREGSKRGGLRGKNNRRTSPPQQHPRVNNRPSHQQSGPTGGPVPPSPSSRVVQPPPLPPRPSSTPPAVHQQQLLPPNQQQTQQQQQQSGKRVNSSSANHFVRISPDSVSATKGKRGAQALLHKGRVYIIRSRNRHFKKENKWYDVYYCEENRKCGCKMSIKSLVGARPPVIFISRGEHTCRSNPQQQTPQQQTPQQQQQNRQQRMPRPIRRGHPPNQRRKRKKKKKSSSSTSVKKVKLEEDRHRMMMKSNGDRRTTTTTTIKEEEDDDDEEMILEEEDGDKKMRISIPTSSSSSSSSSNYRLLQQRQFPPNSFSSGGSGRSSMMGGSPFIYDSSSSIPHYFDPPLCIDRRRFTNPSSSSSTGGGNNTSNVNPPPPIHQKNFPLPQQQQQQQQPRNFFPHQRIPPSPIKMPIPPNMMNPNKPPLEVLRVEPYAVPVDFPYARVVCDRSLIHHSIQIGKGRETVTLSNIDRSVTEEHRIITDESDTNVVEIMFKISQQTRLRGWINVAILLRFTCFPTPPPPLLQKNNDVEVKIERTEEGENNEDESQQQPRVIFASYYLPRAFNFGSELLYGGSGSVGGNGNIRMKKRKRNPLGDASDFLDDDVDVNGIHSHDGDGGLMRGDNDHKKDEDDFLGGGGGMMGFGCGFGESSDEPFSPFF